MKKATYMTDALSSIASASALSRQQLSAVAAFRKQMQDTIIPTAERAILERQRAAEAVRSLTLR